ncbi:MAG: ABC transporter substrate-binding protein [Tabrizicola flagellatus]|uniref:ABC transporter substrate-binding protein n=1 Tax=Tabrizicola flagellatus TaxID=2593021 RepID=UPI00391A2253
MQAKNPTTTRRDLLIGLGAGGMALAAPGLLRAAAARLALFGPPAGPTITLAQAVASGALAGMAGEVTLTVWRNPDALRAGLTSGAIDLSVVPVQAAANLYTRGMGLRLVNVMTNGLLSIVAPEGTPAGLGALTGKRLAVPFVNDTPDFILRTLIAHHGLAPELVATGTPVEAAQMLLAGRIDAALLSEPAATVAVLRGREAGRPMARAVDIQAEWGALTGLGPVVPQAGLAVTRAFAEAHGALIAPLHAALAAATAAVLADPAAAAAAASGPLDQPAPVLAASIPHCNLTATPATAARPAIEAMLGLMAAADPAIIGGRLPDDGFYAL